jgi:HD-like signal output (HDOD) protein
MRTTRVLFVDDEPLVLRSLDRALRTRKVPWDARFVESADAALKLLAAEPFDIVIADLRIPDVDGVELLTEVQRAYPNIARLVLSGQVGTDDCLRAMRVAHQCMAKPCNIDALRHVVQRLSWSQSLVEGEAAKATSAVTSLPSPPRIHLEVCAALRQNAGLAELAKIIDGDVALTAKLIHIVNSAFFAQGAPVTTVQRALSLLGTDVVRGLLLSVEVFRGFEGSPDRLQRIDRLRRHSTFVATLARNLAPREMAGDAFVAGMLHDVGELVLASIGRDGDHARAGGFLLGLWGISDTIVDAVAYHHEPGAVADEKAVMVDILHVAEIVAGELSSADPEVISSEWLARNDASVLERARTMGRELWSAGS